MLLFLMVSRYRDLSQNRKYRYRVYADGCDGRICFEHRYIMERRKYGKAYNYHYMASPPENHALKLVQGLIFCFYRSQYL